MSGDQLTLKGLEGLAAREAQREPISEPEPTVLAHETLFVRYYADSDRIVATRDDHLTARKYMVYADLLGKDHVRLVRELTEALHRPGYEVAEGEAAHTLGSPRSPRVRG